MRLTIDRLRHKDKIQDNILKSMLLTLQDLFQELCCDNFYPKQVRDINHYHHASLQITSKPPILSMSLSCHEEYRHMLLRINIGRWPKATVHESKSGYCCIFLLLIHCNPFNKSLPDRNNYESNESFELC
jgi:hypothetical protein